jgi:hypothetical protein
MQLATIVRRVTEGTVRGGAVGDAPLRGTKDDGVKIR